MMAMDGFEQAELETTKKLLEESGARVDVVSPKNGSIKGWHGKDWGNDVPVDVALKDANAEDYDALVLPGGVMSPDRLRMEDQAVELVQEFYQQGKVVAAICHGPWMLVEAGVARGHEITSWPSLRMDIRNAGGTWVDQDCVASEGVVTSRKPADIPAFANKIIEEMNEPLHDQRSNRRKALSADIRASVM